jgi:hypothetical protein
VIEKNRTDAGNELHGEKTAGKREGETGQRRCRQTAPLPDIPDMATTQTPSPGSRQRCVRETYPDRKTAAFPMGCAPLSAVAIRGFAGAQAKKIPGSLQNDPGMPWSIHVSTPFL